MSRTFAPELVRTDKVTIDEAGLAVHLGETVIHFADGAYLTPSEARSSLRRWSSRPAGPSGDPAVAT